MKPLPDADHPQLLRTLEPEPMDDPAEARAYHQMDHHAVNNAFVEDLIAGGPVGPRVIDLGCGTGLIPIVLCQRLDEIQVMGIDSSIAMLELARIEIELAGMVNRIWLEHADCKQLKGFDDASAQTVISNTVLHHLPEPEQLIAQAIRVLAPGGRLFLRDLVRPASGTDVEALVAHHASTETDEAKQMLRQSLHAALTLDEMKQRMATHRIPSDSIRMTSDRHWTLDWTKDV